MRNEAEEYEAWENEMKAAEKRWAAIKILERETAEYEADR